MTPYNISFMDNSTGLRDIAVAVDSNLDGLLIPSVLLLVWGILFIAGKKSMNDNIVPFTGASLITLFIGVLLFLGGMATYYVYALPLVGFVGGLLAYFITNRSSS